VPFNLNPWEKFSVRKFGGNFADNEGVVVAVTVVVAGASSSGSSSTAAAAPAYLWVKND